MKLNEFLKKKGVDFVVASENDFVFDKDYDSQRLEKPGLIYALRKDGDIENFSIKN